MNGLKKENRENTKTKEKIVKRKNQKRKQNKKELATKKLQNLIKETKRIQNMKVTFLKLKIIALHCNVLH